MKNLMKILAIAMVILTVATSLAGCSYISKPVSDTTKETTAASEPTTAAETEIPVITEAPAETEAPTEAPEVPDVPANNTNNVFFNDTNYACGPNEVQIKPRYVYWDGGKLVAECFVINGYGHTIYDINVKSLSFENESGEIASASFGTMQNATIAPNSHIVWTFTFGEDCVMAPGAALSSLGCKFNVNNKY